MTGMVNRISAYSPKRALGLSVKSMILAPADRANFSVSSSIEEYRGKLKTITQSSEEISAIRSKGLAEADEVLIT